MELLIGTDMVLRQREALARRCEDGDCDKTWFSRRDGRLLCMTHAAEVAWLADGSEAL